MNYSTNQLVKNPNRVLPKKNSKIGSMNEWKNSEEGNGFECRDIDECHETYELCQYNQICINNKGFFNENNNWGFYIKARTNVRVGKALKCLFLMFLEVKNHSKEHVQM